MARGESLAGSVVELGRQLTYFFWVVVPAAIAGAVVSTVTGGGGGSSGSESSSSQTSESRGDVPGIRGTDGVPRNKDGHTLH